MKFVFTARSLNLLVVVVMTRLTSSQPQTYFEMLNGSELPSDAGMYMLSERPPFNLDEPMQPNTFREPAQYTPILQGRPRNSSQPETPMADVAQCNDMQPHVLPRVTTSPSTPQYVLASSPSSSGSIEKAEKGNGSTSPVSDVSIDDQAVIKRRRNNRLAVAKNRKKVTRAADELRKQERSLSEYNNILKTHVRSLRNEVLDLKMELLRHSNCDNGDIQKYIQHAASRIYGRDSFTAQRSGSIDAYCM
ncbi:hypothetical protein F5Y14DRAFT_426848 [Nemania sp. NC0429]|nr:hypothetical protein F5Y14DRAFT_426848 [Nemania sp. NC0429]